MQFKAHSLGGLVAGGAVVMVAAATSTDAGQILFKTPYFESYPILAYFGLFCLTYLMALFPDLDTASIPQKWFLRLIPVLAVLLWLMGLFQQLVWVLVLGLLPLLHRHRGWTHWMITPWILSLAFIFYLEGLSIPLDFTSPFGSTEELLGLLIHDRYLVLAMIAGHYTHLLLDKKWTIMPFLSFR